MWNMYIYNIYVYSIWIYQPIHPHGCWWKWVLLWSSMLTLLNKTPALSINVCLVNVFEGGIGIMQIHDPSIQKFIFVSAGSLTENIVTKWPQHSCYGDIWSHVMNSFWSFWTQACDILLMEEILHQLIGGLSHYLQGFIHPRWCRISSINSMSSLGLFGCFCLAFCSNKTPSKIAARRQSSHSPTASPTNLAIRNCRGGTSSAGVTKQNGWSTYVPGPRTPQKEGQKRNLNSGPWGFLSGA